MKFIGKRLTSSRVLFGCAVYFFICSASGFSLGCAAGNCRSQPDSQRQAELLAKAELKTESDMTLSRVRVYKPDGSLQCDQGERISVQEMGKQLEGIKIYSSENRSDGQMHMQMCGSPTGRVNVYEIDSSSLEAAKKQGFKEWTFD